MYMHLHRGNLDLTRKISLVGGCKESDYMRPIDNDRRLISPMRKLDEERIHEETKREERERERERERVREKRKDFEIKTKEGDINHQH